MNNAAPCPLHKYYAGLAKNVCVHCEKKVLIDFFSSMNRFESRFERKTTKQWKRIGSFELSIDIIPSLEAMFIRQP